VELAGRITRGRPFGMGARQPCGVRSPLNSLCAMDAEMPHFATHLGVARGSRAGHAVDRLRRAGPPRDGRNSRYDLTLGVIYRRGPMPCRMLPRASVFTAATTRKGVPPWPRTTRTSA